MEVVMKASLVKDLQRVKASSLLEKVRTTIERLEQAQSLQSIRHLKKFKVARIVIELESATIGWV